MASKLAENDPRLALRAMYLASLSLLGEKDLIVITKSKSNTEYVKDLERHAHAFPEILEIFKVNVLSFEKSWYGMYKVNRSTLQTFRTNVERIKEHATA